MGRLAADLLRWTARRFGLRTMRGGSVCPSLLGRLEARPVNAPSWVLGELPELLLEGPRRLPRHGAARAASVFADGATSYSGLHASVISRARRSQERTKGARIALAGTSGILRPRHA